jgi:hypothetical protein
MSRWTWILLGVLLLLRVPSLVQPAGADQALYAYVGVRIHDGGLPYRDAWDQKPPAIHFVYSALFAAWPHESVVPAADLATAALVALMLVSIGQQLTARPGAGLTAAALFLFLGDPTFNRLSGVRVRSQCETFIALAVTAALFLAVRYRGGTTTPCPHGKPAGLLPGPSERLVPTLVGVALGAAFVLKYNAAVYVAVGLLAMTPTLRCLTCATRRAVLAGAGFLVPVAVVLAVFAAGGALADLYHATIRYNIEYSGETYAGPLAVIGYLLTFPIQHARVDALWLAGGLGCALLLGLAVVRRTIAVLLPVMWVAAACASIAINGSRGLPQYFVQAAPGLALAAGLAAAELWSAGRLARGARVIARTVAIALVAFGAWRVTDFDKIPLNAAHDLAYMTGRISRDAHLSRYGGQRDEDKYSALAVARLAAYLERRTGADDWIYIFGFSPGAYVQSGRPSASRFFWSRPVIVGFNEGVPGYGAAGVLAELEVRPPKYLVLQIRDWAEPPNDSVSYFTNQPLLGPWLRANYQRVEGLDIYEIWMHNAAAADEQPTPRDRSVISARPAATDSARRTRS